MKRIELKSIHLKNFKGIRNLKIDCQSKVVNIAGDNATGKTTINDAFRWLLFDKDSTDRKQFEIKTLDKSNNPIHGLEHSVTGELFINDQLKTLQKTYKEKWTKKRGEADATFTGHETLYLINDVPVKASEYQAEISNIVDETIFKLITNPLYFSYTMNWQDRRKILLDMVGDPSIDEVVAKHKDLSDLKSLIDDNNVDAIRKGLAARRKKLNDELKSIPVRIDECNNSITVINAKSIAAELEQKQLELKKVEDQLSNISKEDPAITEQKQLLNELRAKINQIENDVMNKRYKAHQDLSTVLRNLTNKEKEQETLLHEIEDQSIRLINKLETLTLEIENYRTEWDKKKAEEFEIDEDFLCPTCLRKLPEETIEKKKAELLENFNKAKAKKLDQIAEDGKEARKRKDDIETQLKQLDEQKIEVSKAIYDLNAKIKDAQKNLSDFENTDPEYPDELEQLKAQAIQLADELDKPKDAQGSIDQLKETKLQLVDEIDSLKSLLQKEESNKQLRIRIQELSNREREVSQQIADLEKDEFLCERFIKAKVELLDQKINSMFSYVRFKLFDEQINGGLTETCEALVDGVPFSDANNAAKINAGIDIINTLSKYYQVSAPIVIDNRESINQILDTNAQVINLIVSKDAKLRIESANKKESSKSIVSGKVAEVA